MIELKCTNCGEVLPPVADAFCSFCHEPIERSTAEETPSTLTLEPKRPASASSNSFATVFLILGCLVGLATLFLAIDSAYHIFTQEGDGHSAAGRAGWKMGQVFGATVRTIIGTVMTACLIRGYIVYSNPDQYSPHRKIREIVDSTRSISTTGVGHPNFYTNASDFELVTLFQQLQRKPNEERLRQLVFESRYRLERAQKT